MLLAGLVRCGREGCGASYQLETSGKLSASESYDYRCYNCRNTIRVGKARVFERAILEHIADRVFTTETCIRMLHDVVEESGMLRAKTAEHRRNLEGELDDVEPRLGQWTEAFERGDPAANIGAERVTHDAREELPPLHGRGDRRDRRKGHHDHQVGCRDEDGGRGDPIDRWRSCIAAFSHRRHRLAPAAGLEPATRRLTAACSTN